MLVTNRLAQTIGVPEDIDVPMNDFSQSNVDNALQFVFGLAAVLALIFIIYGGIQYIVSRGEPDKIQKARNIVIYAVVGLIIAILAFSIVTFVVETAG